MKKKETSKKSAVRVSPAPAQPGTPFCVLMILGSAVLARVVFNLIFLGRYGLHAMGNPETWYYYGVAEGRYRLNLFDPTYWLFRLAGLLFRGDTLLLSVIGAAIILTSLTAVLIFYVVREVHDRRAGLAAGLIYAFLGNPFELSVASFTHDFVQMPLMLLSWLLLLKMFRRGRLRGAVLAGVLVLLFVPGFAVGPLAMATVGVTVLFLARQLISRAAAKANLNPQQENFIFLGLLLLITILFRWVYFPHFWESLSFFAEKLRGLNIGLQRRAGSADLMPLSLAGYWVQYGFLLFLVPFGFLVCFQKKDTLNLANFFVGVIAGMIALRGTRVMDISVAICAAAALINWRKEWFLPAAVLVIFGLPYVITHKFYPSHNVIYSAAAVTLLLSLLLVPGKKYRLLPLAIACLFSIGVSYQKIMPGGPNTPEVEYNLVHSLRERAEEGDRVAVGTWDRGYFAEVVSGMESLTSPGHIDKELNEFFWQPEEIAALNFNRRKAKYIIISERDFKLSKIDKEKNEFRCSHAGGFIMPSPRPSFILLKELLIYQLLYDEERLRFFTKLGEAKDPKHNHLIRLYRVEDMFPEEKNAFLSTRVLKNSGYQAGFIITAGLKNKTTGEIKSQTRTVEFAPEEIKIVTFNHSPVLIPGDWEVSYGYSPLMGYLKGRYRNPGRARTVRIKYILKDTESGVEEEPVEEVVEFAGNETRTVLTRMDFRHPDRQYAVVSQIDTEVEKLSLRAIKPELKVLFRGTGYRMQE